MTYSWYNIRSDYKNKKIKYTHDGSTWQTITFTDGMYFYSDINDYTRRTWLKKIITQPTQVENKFIQ